MNMYLNERQIGIILIYMNLVSTILYSAMYYTLLSKLLVPSMIMLDIMIAYHFFKSFLSPSLSITLCFFIFLHFWIQTLKNGVMTSFSATFGILLWLSIYNGVATFCDKKSFYMICKVIVYPLLFHTVLTIIQRFRVDSVDKVGGIFGTIGGVAITGNHSYILICTIILMAMFLEKKISHWYILGGLVLCLVSATFAEIKIYYFELLVFVFFYSYWNKNMKSIIWIFLSLVLIYLGMYIFSVFNPSFTKLLSPEGLLDYLINAYGNPDYYIGRTNGFSLISASVFNNRIIDILAGNGFYGLEWANAVMMHVQWFSYSSLFYAGGAIGITLIILFFVIVIVKARKKMEFFHGKCALIMGALSIILLFYGNEVLFAGSSPFIFFMLAGCEISENIYV